jgi:hypothetical protein
MTHKTLIIEFCGPFMIRQPTDPDPYDEQRGASGYTFAFGDEPPLNRVIYCQPDENFPARSHTPEPNVRVKHAYIQQIDEFVAIDALQQARFNLLGNPKLENRNWALTRPGFEPIVPFHVEVTAADDSIRIDRPDVLDPENPDTPIMQLSLDAIKAKGARGLEFEPSTVGYATGYRDAYILHKRRRALLWQDLEKLRQHSSGDDPAIAVLEGRIAELDKGIEAVESGKPDRRTGAYALIERFGYAMSGKPATVDGDTSLLHGTLNCSAEAPWRIDFWMGGWSPDTLGAYLEGTLQIPYVD